MLRLISPNTEILILALIGFIVTVIEAMHLNLNENLQAAWKVSFPDDLLSTAIESMVKSVISGIIIIRGVTVHVHLASYLLLVIPVIRERRRVLLLIWLTVAGFRSILLNGVTTIVGLGICSCLPEPHPACFEFLSAKAIELACSVFTWVVVNDFMYYLKKYRCNEAVPEKIIPAKKKKCKAEITEIQSPDDVASRNPVNSEYDSLESFHSSLTGLSASNGEAADESEDSILAKAAVNWFFRQCFGMKYFGRSAEKDEEITKKFLSMSPEEIENLTLKIKKFLANKYSAEGKVNTGEGIVDAKTNTLPDKNLNRTTKNKEDKIKANVLEQSSVFLDTQMILPNFHNISEALASDTHTRSTYKDVASQTDELSLKILNKLEHREKKVKIVKDPKYKVFH